MQEYWLLVELDTADNILKMNRFTIIKTVGEEFLSSNVENSEFSYPKAFAGGVRIFQKLR